MRDNGIAKRGIIRELNIKAIKKLTGNNGLLNIIFPARCAYCDEVLDIGERYVCASCRPKIRYVHEPRCRKCGKQLYDCEQIFCTDCTKRVHAFDSGYALYDYQSMKQSIYRFKYRGRCEYAGFYAWDLYRHFKREIFSMRADAIIPVPIHSSRKRTRGYNQAELVAGELSRLSGIPLRTDIAKRVKKTAPQKNLGAAARQNNLKKAFNINPDVVKLNKTKTIIIIDDIYTTGSTLDAMAYALKKQGVSKVYFFTLCIGEGI